MSTDSVAYRLQQLMEQNDDRVCWVRSSADTGAVDMDRVIAADMRLFGNQDEALLIFISRCVLEAKDVVISPAGPRMIRIAVGHALIRRSR